MAVEVLWPILYPSLIGVACLAYLAWCALRAAPREDESPPDDDHGPRRWRRDPRRPRGPRRGPHAPADGRAPSRATHRR